MGANALGAMPRCAEIYPAETNLGTRSVRCLLYE